MIYRMRIDEPQYHQHPHPQAYCCYLELPVMMRSSMHDPVLFYLINYSLDQTFFKQMKNEAETMLLSVPIYIYM